jgi:hypothetical protein
MADFLAPRELAQPTVPDTKDSGVAWNHKGLGAVRLSEDNKWDYLCCELQVADT